MTEKASFTLWGIRRFGLSKRLFYILVILLPIGTRKIFFTENSYYFGYFSFYNTFFLYLTDLIFFGLILAWISESSIISHITNPTSTPSYSPPSHGGENQSIFHRIFTRITQDKIYRFFAIFWLISLISILVSRETYLGLYGLWKITEFMLIFAYVRENISFFLPLKVTRLRNGQGGGEPASSADRGELFSREISYNPSQPPLTLRGINAAFWLILATLWFQAGLGIWQFINQESLGLKILGEEFLRPGLQGIAEFVSRETFGLPISGPIELIRAYGTLPHPNVLAGLLVVGVMINLYMLYAHNPSQPPLTLRGGVNVSRETPPLKVRGGKGALFILSLSLILISTGLVVTFSRFAWAVAGLAVIFWFAIILTKIRRPDLIAMRTGKLDERSQAYFPGRLALITILLLVSLVINFIFFGTAIKDRLFGIENNKQPQITQSLSDRAVFNRVALIMIKQNPLLGVGLKNFVVAMDEYATDPSTRLWNGQAGSGIIVPERSGAESKAMKLLPYQHQPVHNIYLLIGAEIGLIGLFAFIVALFYVLKNIVPARNATHSVASGRPSFDLVLKYTFFIIFFALLTLGLTDHYFWTIQQGQLAFWIMLGLIASSEQ